MAVQIWEFSPKSYFPLSKPALASVGLFYAVSHWNDFFNSMIYLNSTEKFPVQIILRQIVLLAQGPAQMEAQLTSEQAEHLRSRQ